MKHDGAEPSESDGTKIVSHGSQCGARALPFYFLFQRERYRDAARERDGDSQPLSFAPLAGASRRLYPNTDPPTSLPPP